ncbi:MAG: ABC transporter ATP-binding protein [bacterium]|nr:ABC transporter ATP-binding protein [bacterium]
MSVAVRLEGITKRFPGVVANDRVDLVVEAGEIHAICGENGAGKSTLMKILYGMQAPDEGSIEVLEQERTFSSPREAIDVGIGMVHQHFMLADNLTVIENVILGAEPSKGSFIEFATARSRLRELGDAYGLELDLDDTVGTLEVGERQRIEIIKILYRGARILILDEPTAVLVPQEVEELFRNLRELKAEGHTIIFIDHKLDEVLEIADTITVLRQGRSVARVKPEDVTAQDLAELMVGSELPTPETREATVTDRTAVEVKGISVVDEAGVTRLRDVGFSVQCGEIVGVAGVEGNGQGELVEAILGIAPVTEGSIHLHGDDVTGWSVRQRREAGLGYIPEDRHRRGLLLSAPVWENSILGHQTRSRFLSSRVWIDEEASKSHAANVVKRFDVRTPGVHTPVHALSGGNQQKLVVGREMATECNPLIAAHPTRGIDVGSQAAVWEGLRRARAEGLGLLLISADLEELIGLSDTLLVMLRGEIVARLDPARVTPRELGAYMTGAAS